MVKNRKENNFASSVIGFAGIGTCRSGGRHQPRQSQSNELAHATSLITGHRDRSEQCCFARRDDVRQHQRLVSIRLQPCCCGKYGNCQSVAARIGSHRTRCWGRHDTEACHVPLDRRGTPRTCYLVADKFGFANCQTVAPPALGDMQEGRATLAGGTATAQSCPGFRRLSVKAAAGRVNAVTTPQAAH